MAIQRAVRVFENIGQQMALAACKYIRDVLRALYRVTNCTFKRVIGLAVVETAQLLKFIQHQQATAASGAGGELGIEAEASLLELDLSSNPGKYVQTRAGLGPRGFLVIQVANATKVPMKQIGLTIQYIDSDGRTRTVRRALNGTLAGGKTSQIGTEIGPFTATNQYKVTVNNAAVAR